MAGGLGSGDFIGAGSISSCYAKFSYSSHGKLDEGLGGCLPGLEPSRDAGACLIRYESR